MSINTSLRCGRGIFRISLVSGALAWQLTTLGLKFRYAAFSCSTGRLLDLQMGIDDFASSYIDVEDLRYKQQVWKINHTNRGSGVSPWLVMQQSVLDGALVPTVSIFRSGIPGSSRVSCESLYPTKRVAIFNRLLQLRTAKIVATRTIVDLRCQVDDIDKYMARCAKLM